ncbi:MAG: hypothetical protein HY658_14265 [Actinobacteria bacterium]|nr:hypothetical protein [Actinomycetota bacterium]
MALLKRTLYLQALVWAVVGVALAALPRFLLVSVFGQGPLGDYAWARIVGLQAFTLALVMVLVAHRIEELWWWSWGFVIGTLGIALVVVLNASFGLREGSSPVMWWIFSAVTWGFALSLLWGLFRTGRERPIV